MDSRDQLKNLIRSWNIELNGELLDDTPLITSGVLDSVVLFNLVLWIEEQIGSTIDPTSLDLIEEWNTIADVAAFVERRRVT